MAINIKHVLSELLKLHGLSEFKFSQQVNLPRATINRLTSGKTPDPRISTLKTIADYFNISVEQLLQKNITQSNSIQESSSSISIPILSLNEIELCKNIQILLKLNSHVHSEVVNEISIPSEVFGVYLKDDSMSPHFFQKTLILVDPHKRPEHHDFVLIRNEVDKKVLCRQFSVKGEEIFLNASNSEFPSILFNNDTIILGTVIQSRQYYE